MVILSRALLCSYVLDKLVMSGVFMNFLREGVLVSLLVGMLSTCNASLTLIDASDLANKYIKLYNGKPISMHHDGNIVPCLFMNFEQRASLQREHPEVQDSVVTIEETKENGRVYHDLCWCRRRCTSIPLEEREKIKFLIENEHPVDIVFKQVTNENNERGYQLVYRISNSTTDDNNSRKAWCANN